ncbi:MAG TPA: CAP domain-containing protein [Polyangiaceae bacterium]|nr:CAP domain-containing protein [Polyangiaceae bacterium]
MSPRGAALLLVLGACKQEDEAPPVYPLQPAATVQTAPPPAAPTPTPTPTPTPGGVPAPSPTAASMPAAFGFFCATDNDAQCPFAHCLAGRCGGCTTVNDCKPGTQCVPSLVGQICLPGVAASPTPTPTATAPVPVPVPVPAVPSPNSASPFEAARALCVQRTNEFRARVGVGPVTRRSDTEACDDAEARSDAAASVAHGAFGQCRERAQNECPGWPGAATDVVERCLAMMFAEGPGPGSAHGHYTNMTERQYVGVSCGFTQLPDGTLWVVQNFFP